MVTFVLNKSIGGSEGKNIKRIMQMGQTLLFLRTFLVAGKVRNVLAPEFKLGG